jgi:crotonobetainyl-CoA:carnitine CoA-transferase CaiB-like acyl-CoA transferase
MLRPPRKRTTRLDLNALADAETLRTLVRDADVFVLSHHSSGLEERGFDREDCAAMRPGIVHAFFKGFSPGGPWQDVTSRA